MKEIPLTRGFVALVDDDDYEALVRFKWCAFVSRGKVYAQSRIGGKVLYMHMVIMGLPGLEVDHINGNGIDCTRLNMRLATTEQNQYNKKKYANNTSGFKGVAVKDRSWQAYISFGGKRRPLGTFATRESAARVYDEWAKEAHGEFARLNFPNG